MPPKISKKRTVSSSAESRQPKRTRVNGASPTSATSIPAEKTLSKTETDNTNTEAIKPIPKLKIILTLKQGAKAAKVSSKATPKQTFDRSEKEDKKKSSPTRVKSQKPTTTGSVDDAPNKEKKKPEVKETPLILEKSVKAPGKQSVSLSIEAKNKLSPVSPESDKSTTSACVDNTPSKTKPETKIKTDAVPPARKIIAPKPKLCKLAAKPAQLAPAPPAQDASSKSEIAEKEVAAIRKRSNDIDEAMIKTKTKTNTRAIANPTPRTNQFVPINAPQPKSRAQKSLKELEDAESNVVDGQIQPDNPDDEPESELITKEFDPTNPSLPKSPPRDPVKPFGPKEKKAITIWMRVNHAAGTRGKFVAFQELLNTLGCLDPSFDKEIIANFHHRIERYIIRIKKSLKECGAVLFREEDKLEMEPIFADWTVVWLEEDWDGVIDTRVYYTDNYLEKYSPALDGDDGDEVVAVERPVDEPFEEEAEILYVVDPDEVVANVTNANTSKVKVPVCDSNPYGMADWK
ncbi:uncharacterized protein EAF01_010054 [Botrytis porri]|uniref:Uncharacterized protein n=1 Tax=Botrytis porri TaxID=87229 RepID=A0A4Z1KL50_9HELO|nr:uncharacterized protein EAF01_010054 [Botrytis porri]KAF7894604.1 hypothetical protein EAF01_010054 [Botrytis porri]TGO86787.1 hypothetical protein BPOR_0277g00150 [Botrytis porri]